MKKLLPIGTIVKINDIDNNIIIIGFRGIDDRREVFDYIGLLHPQGFVDRKKVYLFNSSMIKNIIYNGYNTIEEEEFKKILYENYYMESGE